jgi:hypothetical protein
MPYIETITEQGDTVRKFVGYSQAMDNYKLTGAYYPPTDYELSEGKHPNYDYSKDGKCDIHGAFNNHYKRNCPKCNAAEEEEVDYCGVCAGTGEGQHDGTRCWSCNGKGVVQPVKDWEY